MSADLYVRDGSRFVLYSPERQHTPPILRVPVADVPEERPNFTAVAAPVCPHGHFARWARGVTEKGAPNCPPCHRGS